MSRVVALFILIALTLVSCGQAAATPTPAVGAGNTTAEEALPTNPNVPTKPVSLEVWVDLDFTRENTFFEDIAADFERAYPHVEVEVYSFVREGILQRMEHVSKDELPPNVVQAHVYTAAGLGLAEPLEPYWQAWIKEDPTLETQFLPPALNEVTWQEVRYGVPLDVYTVILLYNRQHFDEADIPYPTGSYDLVALRQTAAALTNPAQNRYGIGLTTDPWYVYAWISAAGGDLVTQNPDKGYIPALDTKTNQDVIQFMLDMVKAGYAPRPSSRPRDYEVARQDFIDGKISMYFGEPYDIHLIQSAAPDFPLGVAELPKTPAGESAASVLGSSGFFIPRGSIDQDIAFEFIKWVSNERYITQMARRVGHYPARTWLQTSPEFTENLALGPFFNQLKVARPYRLDLFPRAEEAFWDAVKVSFYEKASPTDALKQAQNRAKNSLQAAAP